MQIYTLGVHTDTGKSHFCAAFCEAFGYDYFKLIQAGTPTDSDFIARFSPKTHIFTQGVFLQTPASPHIAQVLEKHSYNGLEIVLPQSEKLLIETAGGLFTPIDRQHTMIDYIASCKKPCVLVAKYYLGVINHILLCIEALKTREIELLCLVMMRDEANEKENEQAPLIDEFVRDYTQVKIYHLPFFDEQNFTQKAQILKTQMQGLII